MKRGLILFSLLILTACTTAIGSPTPTTSPSLTAITPSPRPIITVRPTYTPKPSTTPYPTVEFAVPPLRPSNYNGPVPEGAIARLGKGNIKAMAITNDKKYLIVGGNVGLYAYRIEDFQEIWGSSVSSQVRSMAVNGDSLVTGMSDGSIVAWDIGSGAVLHTMAGKHDNSIVQIVFNSAGTMVASASNDSIIIIWDAQTGELLQTIDPGHERIGNIAWLPGEDKLMIGSSYVTIWDVTNTEFSFNSSEYDDWSIIRYVFTPDNILLVEYSFEDYTIILREAYSGEVAHQLSGHIFHDMGQGIVASADNSILAVGSGDGLIRLWDITTGQPLAALSGHIDQIVALEFDRNTHTIYSASEDGWIIEWDIGTGKPLRAVGDHSPVWRTVYALAWSPDSITLAYSYGGVPHAGYDLQRLPRIPETMILWNRDDRTYTTYPAQVSYPDLRSLAYSPDGSLLAVGPQYASAILWDVEAVQPKITTLKVECCITFSGDGKLLAAGIVTGLVIGDGHTGELLRRLEQVSLPGIYDLEFNLDNTRLFVGSSGAVFAIDAVSGEIVNQFDTQDEMVHSIALSKDGTKLAAGLHNGSIVVWDIDTKTRIFELTGHTRGVQGVTWSPDGRFILSGSDDGLAIVWDAQTGEQLYILDGHAFSVASVAWSPDGQYIATGSHDGTVIIWEAQ